MMPNTKKLSKVTISIIVFSILIILSGAGTGAYFVIYTIEHHLSDKRQIARQHQLELLFEQRRSAMQKEQDECVKNLKRIVPQAAYQAQRGYKPNINSIENSINQTSACNIGYYDYLNGIRNCCYCATHQVTVGNNGGVKKSTINHYGNGYQ